MAVLSQIYVWMQEKQELPTILDEVVAAGYSGIEGWLDHWGTPDKAAEVAGLLKQRGLSCPSAYANGVFHETEAAADTIARILERAQLLQATLGTHRLTIDPAPKREGEKSDAELAIECRALQKLGDGLRRMSITLGIHNHTPQAASNARELRTIMQHCSPDAVGLALDIEWLHRAGVEPLGFMREYATRIVSTHLRQSHNGIWTEALQDGDLDYRSVAEDGNAVFLNERGNPFATFTWQAVGIVVEVDDTQGEEIAQLLEILTAAVARQTGDEVMVTEL